MAKIWDTGVRTGGKVLLKMDNKVIGFAQSARFRDDYGLEPVHIVGQLQTIEYVPMHARHEIQMSVLVVRNTSLAAMGLEPGSAGSFGLIPTTDAAQLGGGGSIVGANPSKKGTDNSWNKILANADITSTSDGAAPYRVLAQKVFNIEVVDAQYTAEQAALDSFDGSIICRYLNCFFAGGDLSVDANRVLMHNVTFYAQDKDGRFGLNGNNKIAATGGNIPSNQ
ncbi:MAG: hypothetical protein EBY23_02220 [Actinobacteria bacterium]|nr:hypothetical protein [Actinomycetota bacterium]